MKIHVFTVGCEARLLLPNVTGGPDEGPVAETVIITNLLCWR